MTANTKTRPFAVFDLDGTLIRWQLYHAMADAMIRHQLLDPQQYQDIKRQRMEWKKRRNVNAFTSYEQSLIQWLDSRIAGLHHGQFLDVCQAVLDEYIEQTYTYTRDLIQHLRQKDYLLFALSASPHELVQAVAHYYKFDAAQGSHYEIADNRLTGAKQVMHGIAKADYLKTLIDQFHATSKDSVAVGDTLGDQPMMSLSEQPIAFNPSHELYKHARQAGWQIVVERKNVIYQLKAQADGQYILA